MTTMKAGRIRSFGGPEVLELTDMEKPTPKDDEVLIKVRAASVNPVDYKIRSGSYPVVRQDQLAQGARPRRCRWRVHPHVSAVFELKEAADAQAQLERRHAQGKVILQMG